MQPVAPSPQISCPRCAAPMAHLRLPTHGHAPSDVDHCPTCRLVWFDALESVQLNGMGWVRLLRELQQGDPGGVPAAATAAPACPTCRHALKAVHNTTRFGRFRALECPQRHGHLHSHSGLLAERGLVRPLLGPERRALAEERHRIECLNCGAPADGRGADCAYCASPLVVVDLPRLAGALRVGLREPSPPDAPPSPTSGGTGAAAASGVSVSWSCRSCGAALDPSRHADCPQCGHLVVAPTLLDISSLLDQAQAELTAQTAALARATERRAATRSKLARESAQRSATADRRRPGMLQGWGPILAAIMLSLVWLALSS